MSDILIVGDIYLGDKNIQKNAELGNVQKIFGDFADLIKFSEISIANLESPIIENGDKIPKAGPALKASLKSLTVLEKAGFNLLTLANNHILDYGKEGLESTILECQKNKLDFVGAGLSLEEARKVFRVKVENLNIGIINISENEFSTIGDSSYGANPLDIINNSYDIKLAKENNDKVIVIVHGGREHYNLPSPDFQKTLRFFANCGADAVLAHHTHCVSGYEIYNGTPIFYGLGNFLFNNLSKTSKPLWNFGMGIKLIFNKNEEIKFDIYPYQQCLGNETSIQLLKGIEKNKFLKDIEGLNNIITDEKLLFDSWKNYLISQKSIYRRKFFIKNKWIYKLINRKILPENIFYNKQHEVMCINMIKCETHREILLSSLKAEI